MIAFYSEKFKILLSVLEKLLILFFFVSTTCYAQFRVTGKLFSQEEKIPISHASIFLSNTTSGTSTADDGSFIFNGVKSGQYTIVASALGFETYNAIITVNNDFVIPTIELKAKAIMLKDVEIKPNRNWNDNYNLFKKAFFGYSPFGNNCKIQNSEILDMNYDTDSEILTATSNGFLEIENPDLGYKMHYQLREFSCNYKTGLFHLQWAVLFEELKGSRSKQRKWQRNRLFTYLGSDVHFLRSLLTHSDRQEGFITRAIVTKPNLARPDDSLIASKLKQYGQASKYKTDKKLLDSMKYWIAESRLPKLLRSRSGEPVNAGSLVKPTNTTGIFAIETENQLQVSYNGRISESLSSGRGSLITIIEHYLFFDSNGTIMNLSGVTLAGTWGTRRMATLLPVNYDPKEGDSNKR